MEAETLEAASSWPSVVSSVSGACVAAGSVSLGASVAASVCMVDRSAFSGVLLSRRPMATPPMTTAAPMAPINIFLFVSIIILLCIPGNTRIVTIMHDIHGRSLKKYLQIIEGLLCIFLFTIFLSAFMIDPTQLYTGIGGMKCGTGKDRLEESVC